MSGVFFMEVSDRVFLSLREFRGDVAFGTGWPEEVASGFAPRTPSLRSLAPAPFQSQGSPLR